MRSPLLKVANDTFQALSYVELRSIQVIKEILYRIAIFSIAPSQAQLLG
jgi:hypothetical protein